MSDASLQDKIDDLEYELRQMASNMLRVVRGAGKPYVLPQQIINVSEAILEISKTARPLEFVPQLITTLGEGVPDYRDYDDFDDHLPAVVRGSLQIAASRLVEQRTQVAAGEHEVSEGIRQRDNYRERQRQKREEEFKALRATQRKPRTRKKPAPVAINPKIASPPQVAPTEAKKLPGESTADFMRRLSKGE